MQIWKYNYDIIVYICVVTLFALLRSELRESTNALNNIELDYYYYYIEVSIIIYYITCANKNSVEE
jgi:hypothetical protein